MSLFFIHLGMHLVAPWNRKAKLWVKGRKNLLENLEKILSQNKAPLIWFHAASLGEFEQGRPIMERLKTDYPGHKILLSFFSPSGYENKKNYKGADYIVYLPIDRPLYARKFVEIINPQLVIWVKYEYWYYYLTEIKKKNIPLLLVSALFRPSQPFFRWYGKIWRKMLQCFTHIFVQNEASVTLLQNLGISNVSVSGDNRYDRVIDTAEKFEELPATIAAFCQKAPVLVAGSTWAEDEEELLHYTRSNSSKHFIIAPHETDAENIAEIQKRFPQSSRYSSFTIGDAQTANNNVLILDNIGMLSRLYKYAEVAYVGGGFGDDGLHNILEAAVFGKPVIFGPNHEKFPEAQAMIDAGGAFSVENALDLEKLLNRLFEDEFYRKQCSENAQKFIYQNRGATEKIINYMRSKKLLSK